MKWEGLKQLITINGITERILSIFNRMENY